MCVSFSTHVTHFIVSLYFCFWFTPPPPKSVSQHFGCYWRKTANKKPGKSLANLNFMHNRAHNKQSDLYQHCTEMKKNKCQKGERPRALSDRKQSEWANECCEKGAMKKKLKASKSLTKQQNYHFIVYHCCTQNILHWKFSAWNVLTEVCLCTDRPQLGQQIC